MISLERIVNAFVERRTRHHKVKSGEVRVGYLDGTFDVALDDGGSVKGAPPSPGIPALEVEADSGTRCLVAWQDGDPNKPRIVAWPSSGARRVQLGGARPVARIGDEVELQLPPTPVVSGFANGTVTIPGTPPVVVPIVSAPFAGAVVLSDVQAVINTGRESLTA